MRFGARSKALYRGYAQSKFEWPVTDPLAGGEWNRSHIPAGMM
jgi:hypothetical protein